MRAPPLGLALDHGAGWLWQGPTAGKKRQNSEGAGNEAGGKQTPHKKKRTLTLTPAEQRIAEQRIAEQRIAEQRIAEQRIKVANEINRLYSDLFTVGDDGSSFHSSTNRVFKGHGTAEWHDGQVWVKYFSSKDNSSFDDIYNTYLLGESGVGPKVLGLASLWHYKQIFVVMEEVDDAVKRLCPGMGFERVRSGTYEKVYPMHSPDSQVNKNRDKAEGDAYAAAYDATYIHRFNDMGVNNFLKYFESTTGKTKYMILDVETEKIAARDIIDETKKAAMMKTAPAVEFQKIYQQVVTASLDVNSKGDEIWDFFKKKWY